jgi:hypothetical protein
MTRSWRTGAALVSLLVGIGCARAVEDALDSREESPEAAGQALIQRRHDLERIHSGLLALRDSVDVIRSRPDPVNRELIGDFAFAYLAMHVDPLLAPGWQSASPALEGLDAEMRLLEAELLMRLEHRSDAERVLDEIERRFAQRSDLVVNYPVGKQSSLTEAVRIARAPRWWSF